MNRIIITAIGKDRPGLVNKITKIINDNNGSIENSKMIKIDDQFAIIINFTIKGDSGLIEDELKSIEKLSFFCKQTKKSNMLQVHNNSFSIKGADDKGIMDSISNYFKNKSINITQIETYVEQAPTTGSPLFNMIVTFDENEKNFQKIKEDISEICDKMNLNLFESI